MVNAEIEGRILEDVFPIERPYLRNNNTAVWIMNSADQLEIRPVEVVFPGSKRVNVSDGLIEGEQLVITDIAAPVAGMPLRLDGAPAKGPQQRSQTAPGKGKRP